MQYFLVPRTDENLICRNWKEIEELWSILSNKRCLALIRVAPQGKIPAEGTGWEKIGWRAFEEIGFEARDNAGILTGKPSGVIILDVDDLETFNEAQHRNSWSLPATFTVRSGKGFHYYYKLPDDDCDFRNRSRKSEGWDIRANGGFVVAPGSIHPNGQIYTVIDDREFAVAPDWLLDAARGSRTAPGLERTETSSSKILKTVNVHDLPEVNLSKLQIDDSLREAITKEPEKGRRSEAGFAAIISLLQCQVEPDQIVSIFMGHSIGEAEIRSYALSLSSQACGLTP